MFRGVLVTSSLIGIAFALKNESFTLLSDFPIADAFNFDYDSLLILLHSVLKRSSVQLLLITTAVYGLYYYFFGTFCDYRVKAYDVGYLPQHGKSKKEVQMNNHKRRDVGNLPPPYPNGWYSVIWSFELKPGQVERVDALGQQLVVFRTASGKPSVLDAYCPHLGANLAEGGVVIGEHLQCPFHGWEFGVDGNCKHIPYSDKIPSLAKSSKTWTVLEVNGQVLVWFDAEDREPQWYPEEIKEISTGEWTLRGRSEHFISAHIQEVPENAADVAHLTFLHSPVITNGTDLRQTHRKDWITHQWDATFTPGEGDTWYQSKLNLFHHLEILGKKVDFADLHVDGTQAGPGLVYLKFKSALGTGVFVQSIVPEEPRVQKLQHVLFCSWSIPSLVSKIYLIAEAKQVERDIMIWNSKKFQAKPVLVKEDKPIKQFRRWYSNFYSEKSMEVFDKKQLDW